MGSPVKGSEGTADHCDLDSFWKCDCRVQFGLETCLNMSKVSCSPRNWLTALWLTIFDTLPNVVPSHVVAYIWGLWFPCPIGRHHPILLWAWTCRSELPLYVPPTSLSSLFFYFAALSEEEYLRFSIIINNEDKLQFPDWKCSEFPSYLVTQASALSHFTVSSQYQLYPHQIALSFIWMSDYMNVWLYEYCGFRVIWINIIVL